MKEFNKNLKDKFLNYMIPSGDRMTKADSKFKRISKDIVKTQQIVQEASIEKENSDSLYHDH